jgi:hypothetical protein
MPGYLPYMPPPPQPKKSLRWLWILLSVLGGLLVLSCGSCTVAVVYYGQSLSSSSDTKLFSSASVNLGTYYLEIEQKEYDLAYKHLAPDAAFTIDYQSIPITSQVVFDTTEQELNTRFGQETHHLVYLQNINSTTATLSVTVTRGGQDYTELVTMKQTGRSSSDIITWFVSHETIIAIAATPTPS